MANSKIQLANGLVLLDLTSDTVSPDTLLAGYTAHDKTGALITGQASPHPTLQVKSATPTKASQTIQADSGFDGLLQVNINPIPSNYIDTSDANAGAGDIRSGKSAYVNGLKVNGSLVTHVYRTGHGAPSDSLGSDGDLYFDLG